MKIAHITPVYPPYTGGIGSVAHEYAHACVQDGDSVTVFTPRYQNLKNSHGVLDVERIKPWYQWGNAAFIPQLIWRLRTFDVLHLHYPFYGAAIATALASVLWHKPLIATYHMKPVARGWLGWIFSLYRWLAVPFVFACSDVLCVSSLDYANAVGLEGKKRRELPFSVDVDRFKPGEAFDIREKLNIERDSHVLIFVGGLDDAHYFKGVDVLLEACADIKKDVVWDLIIVGEGNRKAFFQELAKQNGIEGRVHFAGRVSDEDLPRYYRAADIHVLPAINQCEAFGLVTLEAAASAMPSIVSDLPGVRTLVREGETGFIVEPSNIEALTKAFSVLMSDDEKRYQFGRAARIRVEKTFAPSVIHRGLKDIYKSVTMRRR